MSLELNIKKWLIENTNLDWERASGDSPAKEQDRLYINRSEVYEMCDFMVKFFKLFTPEYHYEENYETIYNEIRKYKKGEKVKSKDMLTHLNDIAEEVLIVE